MVSTLGPGSASDDSTGGVDPLASGGVPDMGSASCDGVGAGSGDVEALFASSVEPVEPWLAHVAGEDHALLGLPDPRADESGWTLPPDEEPDADLDRVVDELLGRAGAGALPGLAMTPVQDVAARAARRRLRRVMWNHHGSRTPDGPWPLPTADQIIATATTTLLGLLPPSAPVGDEWIVVTLIEAINDTIGYLSAAWKGSGDDDPTPAPMSSDGAARTDGAAGAGVGGARKKRRVCRLRPLERLTPWMIARLMLFGDHIVRVQPSGHGSSHAAYDLLCVYQCEGPHRGLFRADEDELARLAHRWSVEVRIQDLKEIERILRFTVPRVGRTTHPDVIAVNNGVLNYGVEPVVVPTWDGREVTIAPKTLHPFDPGLVFLSKSGVDWCADAPNPVLTHPDGTLWDVESWMRSLSSDPEIPELLWELVGAVLRPHVAWNKSAWFFSEVGNNGKGTVCALLRNMVGAGAHCSIPLTDFAKNFALEPLIHAQAIIVDENDVGAFIDRAANLKAVVTGDVIQVDRKYRTPVSFQFHGFMVQCLNDEPRVRDRSDSFYRRQLFVPFDQSFTGRERREIKNDFLARREVLEYVLWRTVMVTGGGAFYELSEPDVCARALDEYRERNDPTRQFWVEFKDRFAWDLLPFGFLYDLYQAWFRLTSPSGTVLGRNNFLKELRRLVDADVVWGFPRVNDVGEVPRFSSTGRMTRPEPLIMEYDLGRWFNTDQSHPDLARRCTARPNVMHRGVVRVGADLPDDPDSDPTGYDANHNSDHDNDHDSSSDRGNN